MIYMNKPLPLVSIICSDKYFKKIGPYESGLISLFLFSNYSLLATSVISSIFSQETSK